MSLQRGTRLGAYEITGILGAGGMGEVYRARDTKLERLVAIKILPESFAHEPERLARFEREAKTLAALNHPNIAIIHGFEETNPSTGSGQAVVHALVMELVDGPTLGDRIAEGPIPFDEALPIAKQIAGALETAHEQGIIHRDLKPANVKVRDDGTVKVLDFGLAKALEPPGASAGVSQSPTITTPAMTQAGVILGTAAYMSPEQAKGKPADKRSDVWAFGCVLYEMLTGRRAFDGEDVSDTLAAVLRAEPDWTALPPRIPPQLRTIIRRCLEKDRKARIPDIAVVRFMLDDASATPTAAPAGPLQTGATQVGRRGWITAAVLGVAFLIASGLATFMYFSPAPIDDRAIRFSVTMPDGWSLSVPFPSPGAPPLAVSPDGRRIAFVATSQGARRLWVRSLDARDAQALPGTDGAAGPFWSPDSRVLAFFADGRLKKIDLTGGPLVTLCDAPAPMGGAWSPEGFIIFGSIGNGLQRVAAAGGVPTVVTTLAQGELAHTRPSFLPDGRHFFYRVLGPVGGGPLYISSIDSTERTVVTERPDASNVMYTAGHLLFLRETTLMAQPFDLDRLALTGEPVPVAEQVMTFAAPAMAVFSASQNGVLAYQQGTRAGSQLTWFDPSGKALGTLGDPARFEGIELSPDGKRVAVSIRGQTPFTLDMWVVDVARGLPTRFTFDAANEYLGKWSPNGDRLVFSSDRDARPGLYLKPSSGSAGEQVLLESSNRPAAGSWSPDGRFLLYTADGGKTAADLWVLPLSGERKLQPFLQTDFQEDQGRFSPDGRWIAYRSNESGRFEVYVTAFPGAGGKWQVSTTGGGSPRWRRDGKEIFYVDADNMLVAAEVNGQGGRFEVRPARPLFEVQPSPFGGGYDVAADGQRFLVRVPMYEAGSEPFDVVSNWTAGLKK